jgi:predicted TIM-barrel fold metal-dependent hydrolase
MDATGEVSESIRNPSRRGFLQGLAVLGAASAASNAGLLGQVSAPNSRVIDCHHHFVSPAYIKALSLKDGHHVAGYTTWFALDRLKDYTPAQDLETMDREGVAVSMLSCTTPGVWFGDPDETRAMTREMNEFGARIAAGHRGRFGLFALLPLPTIDDSLREIEYVFDTLKADGVGLVTSYGNHWLGDPAFRPVFDELNRRKAIVYTHPIDAPCCQDLMPGVSSPTLEYNTDTARTIFSLLATGAATRYADIRFIFSHAGGTMPSLVERFGIGAPDTIADNLARAAEPNSRLFHLRRFFYDTAQSTNPVQMQGLKTIAGASQIVFGTDYPFVSAAKHLQGLDKCGFSAAELRGIHREKALRILPKYKS